jgi:hypothetical protein
MKSSRKLAASLCGMISRGWAYPSRVERTLRKSGFRAGAIHGQQTSLTRTRRVHHCAVVKNLSSSGLGPSPNGRSSSWGGSSRKCQRMSIPRSIGRLAELERGAVIVAKSWRITGSSLLATEVGGWREQRFIWNVIPSPKFSAITVRMARAPPGGVGGRRDSTAARSAMSSSSRSTPKARRSRFRKINTCPIL